MKIRQILYIISLFSVFSCGNDPEESNVISMEDFMGETGEIIDTVKEEVDTTKIVVSGTMNQFINNQLELFDTTLHTDFHPLDRFTFNQRKKIIFKSKTDVNSGSEATVTPRAKLYYYTFADTTKTKNAFYNWLDCFGDECDMITLNEDFPSLKMPPKYVIVYDTVIISVDYRCEDQAFKWRPFQDSITSRFGKKARYKLQVGCGGPLKWK